MNQDLKRKVEELAQRVASRFDNVSVDAVRFVLFGLNYEVQARINGKPHVFPVRLSIVEDAFDSDSEGAIERALAHAFAKHGAQRKGEA